MEAPKIVLRPQKGVVGAGSSTEIQKDIKVHMCEKNKRFLLNRYICVPFSFLHGERTINKADTFCCLRLFL